MIEAVIFDFDGTLVDTIGCIWEEYQRVIEVMGLRKISKREFTHHIGRAWEDILKTMWPGVDTKEFTKHYRLHVEKFKKFPGTDEMLMQLMKDHPLFIMTSRGEKTFYPGMKEACLNLDVFKATYHRDSLKFNKPDPRALLEVCKFQEIKPNEAVYIGDSIIDAQCALNAKLNFVAVLTGGAYPEDFRAIGVKDIIASVAELPPVIKNLSK
jgi:phosphoglycolate phosphatase